MELIDIENLCGTNERFRAVESLGDRWRLYDNHIIKIHKKVHDRWRLYAFMYIMTFLKS